MRPHPAEDDDLTAPVTLEERAAVSDLVIDYTAALDVRGWSMLRSLLADPVWIDYGPSIQSSIAKYPQKSWVERATEGLSGFDVSQYLSANHRHRRSGDNSIGCASQMQARHFLLDPSDRGDVAVDGALVAMRAGFGYLAA